MASLNEYLSGQLQSDQLTIREIENTLSDVCNTLSVIFDGKYAWPYEIREVSAARPSPRLSHSTTAMVAGALGRATGLLMPRAISVKPLRWPLDIFPRTQQANIASTVQRAATLLTGADGIVTSESQLTTSSETFGTDDVLTLSCLADLARSPDVGLRDAVKAAGTAVKERFASFNLQDPKALLQPENGEAMQNAFLPLRAVQTIRDLEIVVGSSNRARLEAYQVYFETRLHQHLSYSAIPDSRFDPAELCFSLEGLLQVQRQAVDRSLIHRVIEVLEAAQDESAYWRPTKPIVSTSRGMTLFPVSVEVANSLIRSCEIFDDNALFDTVSSRCVPLLHRYWSWLRARAVRFSWKDQEGAAKELVGWHSEHINEPDRLHPWETSQVVEFLLSYRRAVLGNISRTALTLSGFSIREPDARDPRKSEWKKITADYEPNASTSAQVYGSILDKFVKGWSEGNPKHFSMMLYGPPGTGKTTVAENIADHLGFRLITITVSDFLSGGTDLLERNAKAIFDVLGTQTECVILFDEIDSFLLDRDSPRHEVQETQFQFMTPGMLTKLNDLRRLKRSLFIIATNYESRIDPAIKRTGRIDATYLLLPPNAAARRRILTKLVEKAWKVEVNDRDGDLPEPPPGATPLRIEPQEWSDLQEASLFLGFRDMEAGVGATKKGDIVGLGQRLRAHARTTRLAPYEWKFTSKSDRQQPRQEFLAMVKLALEVNDETALLTDGRPTSLATAAAEKLQLTGNDEADAVIKAAMAQRDDTVIG